MSAKVSRLGSLHDMLTEALIAQLTATDEDGKLVPPSPQVIAQVIRFLDTNGIQADEDNPRMKAMTKAFSDNVRQFPFDPAAEAGAGGR